MGRRSINDILTNELLIEVLCRLPCKFVIQCKTICKLWLSIISNPCFASCLIGHQIRGNPREGLLFQMHRDQMIVFPKLRGYEISLDFLPCFQGRIISSCNDLLLCSTWGSDQPYYVCNPFTKQWTAVPPPPRDAYGCEGHLRVGFVCESYYHIDDQGGVVLNPHPRFKILRAFGSCFLEEPEFGVDIFSSETGKWYNVKIMRELEYIKCAKFSPTRVVSYDGRIYLQVGMSIVIYDPYKNEVCGEIGLPGRDKHRGRVSEPFEGFSASCGALRMCQLQRRKVDLPKLFMWSLENENNWSLKQCVSRFDPATDTCLAKQCLKVGRVLAIHPNDSDIVYMSINSQHTIIAWNLRTGITEEVYKSDILLPSWAQTFFLEVPVWTGYNFSKKEETMLQFPKY